MCSVVSISSLQNWHVSWSALTIFLRWSIREQWIETSPARILKSNFLRSTTISLVFGEQLINFFDCLGSFVIYFASQSLRSVRVQWNKCPRLFLQPGPQCHFLWNQCCLASTTGISCFCGQLRHIHATFPDKFRLKAMSSYGFQSSLAYGKCKSL